MVHTFGSIITVIIITICITINFYYYCYCYSYCYFYYYSYLFIIIPIVVTFLCNCVYCLVVAALEFVTRQSAGEPESLRGRVYQKSATRTTQTTRTTK
jgi:hypothetical protein